MPTTEQLNANRANAQKSTGPRTDAGKAVSSRNHLTLGLFTRKDYVTWEEDDLYTEFCGAMHLELSPEGLLEEALATEATSATWRLRRCSNAEYEVGSRQEISADGPGRPYRHDEWPQSTAARQDPLLDGLSEKALRSTERARTSAFSMISRATNHLRKLQTERSIRFELSDGQTGAITLPSLADSQKVAAARRNQERAAARAAQSSSAPSPNDLSMAQIMAMCEPPPEIYRTIDAALEKCRLKEEAEKAAEIAADQAEAEAARAAAEIVGASKTAEAEDPHMAKMRARLQELNDLPAQLAARRAEFKKRTEEYLASNCTPAERAEAERHSAQYAAQYAAQVQAELADFCGFKLSAEDLAAEEAA